MTTQYNVSPKAWMAVVAVGMLGCVAALDASTLVVANKAEATVSLVDLASGEVRATLPTGEGPHEVAVSPDGKLALVGNYGTRPNPGSSLTLVSVPEARVVRTIDLGEYRRPHGIVWLVDGRRVVVTAEANKALLVVDTEAGKVLQAISTDQEISHMVATTPDGRRAFVTNIRSGSVTAVDLVVGKALASVPTGEGAEGVTVTPDGAQVWITNRGADTLTVLDVSSLAVLATIPCAAFPIRAVATPDGKRVLVTNARSGDLAVLDVASRTVERRVALPVAATETAGRLFGDTFGDSSVPIGVVVTPDGTRAFVAHANADVITVLDLATWSLAGTLRAGKEPDGMGYSALVVGAPAAVPVKLAPRCGSKGRVGSGD